MIILEYIITAAVCLGFILVLISVPFQDTKYEHTIMYSGFFLIGAIVIIPVITLYYILYSPRWLYDYLKKT